MLVKRRMSHPVLTIEPTVPAQEALLRMRKDKIHRYPVVDRNNNLVGIVTESDLMRAQPSEATTLSVWEINSLLSKITVERVMTRDVVTVQADATIEEAARIMADANISGLPVMVGDRLAGMITQTDLFHVFLEILGARISGIRVTVMVEDKPGIMYKLTEAISGIGGDIKGMGAIQGDYAGTFHLTMKITDVTLETLREVLTPLVLKMVDIREEKVT